MTARWRLWAQLREFTGLGDNEFKTSWVIRYHNRDSWSPTCTIVYFYSNYINALLQDILAIQRPHQPWNFNALFFL